MENVKIKINIKTFLIYEKITNQSFNHIDYSNPDNLGTLLYSCFIANNDYKLTQDSFNSFISNNKKFADKITTAFQEEIEFTKQFINKTDEKTETAEVEQTDYFLKDVVPILCMNCNLDIKYILYELEIGDMHSFLEAYNKQCQAKLEMERLWTYFNIMPHIDSKKLKSPKDLIKFNWEEDEKVDVLKDWDATRLDDILNSNTKQDDGK